MPPVGFVSRSKAASSKLFSAAAESPASAAALPKEYKVSGISGCRRFERSSSTLASRAFPCCKSASAQPIGRLGISWLHLVCARNSSSAFGHCEDPAYTKSKFEMQLGRIGTQTHSFAKLLFRLGHLSQHEIIFRQGLVSARRIGISSQQSVNRLFRQ